MSMMPLTAAFVISNRTVWEQAHACVQTLPVRLAIEQSVGQSDMPDPEALLDRIARHRVDVVLVETSTLALPLEEFVRRLRATPSQPAVFVLNPDASPTRILEALRAGANEYLYPPLADTLRDALQRLSVSRSRSGSDASTGLGKIFGFLSVRGGCGATTFAAHAATSIARQTGAAKAETAEIKQRTLLADLDFDAGLLRFLTKAKNTYTVRDAIDNLRRMDASLWKGLVSSCGEHLDVIPAPDELAAKRAPGREEMMHLTRFMRSAYPISIVDFGRSVSVAALDSLTELEALYLVTNPDSASLESGRRAIHMIEERGFAPSRLKVLLNRVADRRRLDVQAIEASLGHGCEALFRNDHMALYEAHSEGRLLPPTTVLGKDLNALGESIRALATGRRSLDAKAAPEVRTGPTGARRWLSFFQKGPAIPKGAQA